MTLFTKTQTEQLIANCHVQILRMDNQQLDIDFTPVVKLFTPDAHPLGSSPNSVSMTSPSVFATSVWERQNSDS